MSSSPQHKEQHAQLPWGLLPQNAIAHLRQKEWLNKKNLKNLLKGDRPFPIIFHLKPPQGNAILKNINHFQTFIASWKEFIPDQNSRTCEVIWEKRRFRQLSEQMIPVKLIIHDIATLACILGKAEENQLIEWRRKISFIMTELHINTTNETALFNTLINHLDAVIKLDDCDLRLLVKLIPQLKQGMGKGCYLRSLPVTYVDTKFIESNFSLIESVADAVIDPTIKERGLLDWLQCRSKPMDWLLVRPLCSKTRKALGGVPLLRLASDTIQDYELPAHHILIIENEQPCLALPEISGTIAIAGGGKNVSWMRAAWLTSKRVAYWGDLDSEGFRILSDARSKLSTLTPLMMDRATVEAYMERMVDEFDPFDKEPIALNQEELKLFRELRSKKYLRTRLEQERLPVDYVKKIISAWVK